MTDGVDPGSGSARLQSHMREAAAAVLGTMFLTPVLSEEEFPPRGWVDPIIVGLSFQGDRLASARASAKGRCALAAEEATVRVLANIFLCPDDGEPLPRTQLREVLYELANMICGPFLGQFDAEASFRLSPPVSLLPGEGPLSDQIHRRTFCLAEGSLVMIITIDEDAATVKSQEGGSQRS